MHRVVAIVRSVQSMLELGFAGEVFGMRRPGVPQHYEFELCTEVPGPVATSGGYPITVSQDLGALTGADTVVVPGWTPVEEPVSAAVRAALVAAHERGARLATICSGVFALARTGLLDGRPATTHHSRVEHLQREFPQVRVQRDVRYVDDGDIATSAGAGAGMDLCLHLVRRDHGAAHAALIARDMVLPGDRSQHAAASDPLDGLLDWAGARLAEPLSVDVLAAQLRISPRTLARRFADRLGTSPGAWLWPAASTRRALCSRRPTCPSRPSPTASASRRRSTSGAGSARRWEGTTPGGYRRTVRGG